MDAANGYAELEFDLPTALLNSVIASLSRIAPVSLTPSNTSAIPEEQGVYQIFHHGSPVYVGKTDADAGLAKRLLRHSRKIQHRVNLSPEDVTFKALRIYVFTAMDIETDLIRSAGGIKSLPWNGSGFGSNDPGRERDTTKNKPTNFDALYPADIDFDLNLVFPEGGSAAQALALVRHAVPWSLRAERRAKSGAVHDELTSTIVALSSGRQTARAAIKEIVAQLPPGWQATKLLGYVILYRESREYPDAEIIARS